MTNLYGEVLDLLGPNFRADPEVQALSHAIKLGVYMLINNAEKAMVYCGVDYLDGSALDLLAAELRTQYYDTSFPVEKKRELVKNTLLWHQRAGTAGAVSDLVKKVYGEDAVISEWYEYNGAPYTFMVSARDRLNPESINLFNDILKNAKNIRSTLAVVGVSRDAEYHLHGFHGMQAVKRHAFIFDTEVLE